MDIPEPLLTTEDVANFLKVDVVTVRRLVSRNEIGAYRIGNEFRFAMSDVRAYLERQYSPAQPGTYNLSSGPLIVTEDAQGFLRRFRPALLGGKSAASARAWPRGPLTERFTRLAKRTLTYAQEEARSFQHAHVGTEHLLLALIRNEDGIAGRVLHERSMHLDAARQAVESVVGRGEASDEQTDRELTASAKKAIENALQEANKFGDSYIGTEHLLLGLISKDESVAAGVAHILRVDLQTLRDDVLAAMGRGPAEPAQPQAPTAVQDERSFLDRLTGKRARKGSLANLLTKRAISGMNAALKEARMLDKPYVGTDHMLLGMLTVRNGLAAKALGTLGVSSDAAREAAASQQSGETVERQVPPNEIPMTTATERMMAAAFDEAKQLGHGYVGTEHLVLGMLRDENNDGCGVLKAFNVDFERLRAELKQSTGAP